MHLITRIHPTAEVDSSAQIGEGSVIWHHAQVREHAQVGRNCIIGKGVYVDHGVHIADQVKIQNYASIFQGVTLEQGVFIGPYVCFTNDLRPRAVNPDGSLKASTDWEMQPTLVRKGATLGANSTILCGISIGEWAMIGAGSIVTRDVPAYGLVSGNPARLRGFVCPCGGDLRQVRTAGEAILTQCHECTMQIEIPGADWRQIYGFQPDSRFST